MSVGHALTGTSMMTISTVSFTSGDTTWFSPIDLAEKERDVWVKCEHVSGIRKRLKRCCGSDSRNKQLASAAAE